MTTAQMLSEERLAEIRAAYGKYDVPIADLLSHISALHSRIQGQLVEARKRALEDAAAAVGFGPQPPKPLNTEQRDWFLKQFRALNQAVTCGSHENSQR